MLWIIVLLSLLMLKVIAQYECTRIYLKVLLLMGSGVVWDRRSRAAVTIPGHIFCGTY